MTAYNKTLIIKRYGNERFKLVLPASRVAGQRGPGVVIDAEKHHAIGASALEFLKDREAGEIEVVA